MKFFIFIFLFFSFISFCSANSYAHNETRLLSPRRNQACAILPANATSPQTIILIGGRWSPTIEAIDLERFEHRLLAVDPMLESHHNTVEMVAGYPDSSDTELWVLCGFSGNDVNNETDNEHVIIVSVKTGQIRRGPRFPKAFGACSSMQFGAPIKGYMWHPNTWTPAFRAEQEEDDNWLEGRFLCAVGGFEGEHHRGRSLPDVSCWDRVREKWVDLPPLPRPSDHHNTVMLRHGMCPGARDSVVMLNPRSGPYRNDSPLVQQLVLGDSRWRTWSVSSHKPRGAAGMAITKDGIVVTIGGVNYLKPEDPESRTVLFSTLQLFDLCNRRICYPKTAMRVPKWALTACSALDSDMVAVCGGASTEENENKNHEFCEYFDVRKLVEECEGRWMNAPLLELEKLKHKINNRTESDHEAIAKSETIQNEKQMTSSENEIIQ